jgi:hypothetical protein
LVAEISPTGFFMILKIGSLLFIFLLFAVPIHAFAEKIKSLKSDGSFVLDNKDQESVRLAGLALAEESLPLVATLLAGKEVDISEDKNLAKESPEKIKPVYLYVKTKELDLPFELADKPRESKIMVNELLILMGAARLDEERPFKERELFLKAESRAKERGEGIWSYDPSRSKK